MNVKYQYGVFDNLSSVVTDYIKNKILTGDLKEGDRILEIEVANEFNISRAPVRESIKELENQGLLVSIPRKGTFVAKFSMEDIEEIFDIRLQLENSVLEILINEEKLREDDFEQLNAIVKEMENIAKSELDDRLKLIRINELDIEFHNFLWKKSGSKRRHKILSDLYCQLRMAMLVDTRLTGDLTKTATEHYIILESLKAGNLEECKKSLYNHIHTSNQEKNNKISYKSRQL